MKIFRASLISGQGILIFGGLIAHLKICVFVKSLKVVQPTMSLAGVESTITSPIQTSHKKMDPVERDKIGITKNLLRLSVGIEDADDLIKDLSNSLEIHG